VDKRDGLNGNLSILSSCDLINRNAS